MHEEVLHVIAKHPNICKHIHLPVQSGSDRILKEMNRLHTREEYLNLIEQIHSILPEVNITQDMIAGFPSETEEDHRETLRLMESVKYGFGYMYSYSERPGTLAERKMIDNIPEEVKLRRLQEIVDLQRIHSGMRTKEFLGKTVEVLIEKISKKSDKDLSGRNSQGFMVVFPREQYKIGDFVNVLITNCTSGTLIGNAIGFTSMQGN
jgi:tRNA-2-methylthio-N6-dimethylallyladenosine synthase